MTYEGRILKKGDQMKSCGVRDGSSAGHEQDARWRKTQGQEG